MNIITTPRELMDCGRWLRACELLGINEWAVVEGLMDGDDEIRIGREQAEQIGLLPATTIPANALHPPRPPMSRTPTRTGSGR